MCIRLRSACLGLAIACCLTSCYPTIPTISYMSKGAAYLHSQQAVSKQLVNQFQHENALLFRGIDGNYELTMFSSPVYIQEGDAYDLCDNTIIASEEGNTPAAYTNRRGGIRTTLPQRLSADEGIRLAFANTSMTILPQMQTSGKAKQTIYTDLYSHQSERLCYSDVFGKGSCAAAIDDFGVNLELEVKTALTKIEFLLEIENVTVDRSCPDYVLFRGAKDKEAVAIVYQPVFAAKEDKLLQGLLREPCDMSVQEESAGRYRLTITIPENLAQEKSSWPLKISQSFHLYQAKQPDSAIYSQDDAGYYLNDKVVLGHSNKGEGQLNVRFEALDLLDISPEDVLNAEYIISEISGGCEPAKIAMVPIVSEWCSLNTRWNTRPELDEDNARVVSVTTSGDYSFDVTEPLKRWLENRGLETNYIIRHGFALVNQTPQTPKVFATGDNGMFTTCLKIQLKNQEENK